MRAFLLLLCFALSLHALKVNGNSVSSDNSIEINGADTTTDTKSIQFEDDDYWSGIFSVKNSSDSLVNFDFNGPTQNDSNAKYHLIYAFIDNPEDIADLSLNPKRAAKSFTFYGVCPKTGRNNDKALHAYEIDMASGQKFPSRKATLRASESPSLSVRIAPQSEKYLFLTFQECSSGELLPWDPDAIEEISKNLSNKPSSISNVYALLTSSSNPTNSTVFIQDGIYYFRGASRVLNTVIINQESTRKLRSLKKVDPEDSVCYVTDPDTGRMIETNCDSATLSSCFDGIDNDGKNDAIKLKYYKDNEAKETCKEYKLMNTITKKEREQTLCVEDSAQVGVVDNFKYKYNDSDQTIKFTVPNSKDIFYRKMFLEVTCKYGSNTEKNRKWQGLDVIVDSKNKVDEKAKTILRYYFDARPAKLVMTPEIIREHDKLDAGSGWKADDLYAEYEYPVGHTIEAREKPLAHLADPNQNDMLTINLRKNSSGDADTPPRYETTHKDTEGYNDKIKIIAVDGAGDKVESYTSLVDVWIVNALYHKDKELEPSCVGFSDTCTSNFINMIEGENYDKTEGRLGIYTHIVNGKKYLRYNNVGPTQIYARDQEWSYFSINHGGENKACIQHSTSNTEDANGRIGCNVGLVTNKGENPTNKGVDFYYFKPAVFKLKVDIKNSPESPNSYGSKYYTYMHTINEKQKSNTNLGGISTITDKNGIETLDIFESASIDANILAIGASEDSFKNEKTLSDYDADLQIAKYVEFENLGSNPKLKYQNLQDQKKGDIVDDMPLYILANQDLASAIMIDVSEGVLNKAEKISKAEQADKFQAVTITEDDGTTSQVDAMRIDKDWTNFSGGRNVSKYKLNFDRNDLIAKSFVRVDINTTKLNDDIFGDGDEKPEEWEKLAQQNISISGKFHGEDLMFIDPAIIAPDFSSNGANDAAVFLAAYCEKDCDKYFGARVPNHIRYYALPINVIDDNKVETSKTALFSYSGATFKDYKKGADYLTSTTGGGRSSVTLKLQGSGDETKNYCSLFRNCVPLGGSDYGIKFDVFFSENSTWTGGGEEQGDTIVGGKDSTQKSRKAPRMSF